MKEQRGDPFQTKALHKQRARQRYILRTIPDGYLRRVPPIGNYESDSAPFLEIELRRIFDEEANGLYEVLTKLEIATKGRILSRFASSRLLESHRFERKQHPFATEAEPTVNPEDIPIDDELMGSFQRLTWSGIWADELTSDGYEDPRLVQGGNKT